MEVGFMINTFESARHIADGLASLYREVKVNFTNEEKNLIAGVDGGSTTTRVVLLDDMKDVKALDVVYSIPSDFGIKEGDGILLPQSAELFDNMESSVLVKNNDFLKDTKMLRGALKQNSPCTESHISSIDQKLDSAGFYLNMIDAIGYAVIQKFSDACPRVVNLYMGASLRPNDVNTESRRTQFINRIKGTYIWSNPFLDGVLTINIKRVDVQTEAEAQEKGFFLKARQKAPVCFATFEIGGSSIGTSIMKNGVKIDKAEKPLSYGGAQLLEILADNCRDSGKLDYLPSLSVLEEAINSGYLKEGTRKISIVKEICDAKDKLASQIAEDFRTEVLAKMGNFSFKEVEKVFFGGRVFKRGEFGEFAKDDPRVKANGYSLSIPLASELQKLNNGFVCSVIKTNLIPFSNCLLAAKKFGQALAK